MSDVLKNLSPDKVRLGVTPTLWWNDDFPSIDIGIPFGQCVSEMALAGFSGTSIGHKYPADPAELRRALDLRGLEVSEPNLTRHDLFNADECFLTGTGAEIIPVVKIDGRVIGKGKPGLVTEKLVAQFRQLTQVSGEPI